MNGAEIIEIEELIFHFQAQSFPNDQSKDVNVKQTLLHSWYTENRRKLPWRGDNTNVPRSAYGTWVSEVMLQQTRVDTVIDYWNRWMEKFPTVETLADASSDDVNKLWAGLGYYRRAQQLLKGAQVVVADFGGEVPSSVDELLRIPGIGPYTAGAISSIAYNRPEPLVDGNVIRVLSRLYALDLEVGAAGGVMERRCWELARSLVHLTAPGDFNQALMELGATVCKPTNPSCGSCPVASVCRARQLVDARECPVATPHLTTLPADVSYFPRKIPKKKAREVSLSVAVLINKCNDATKYLFNRRPAKGLLANQWEFPSVELNEASIEVALEDSASDTASTTLSIADNVQETTDSDLRRPLYAYLLEKLSVVLVPLSPQPGAEVSAMCRSPAMTLFETCSTAPHRKHAPIVHVFSHQRHTMHITEVFVGHIEESSAAGAVTGDQLKWMTAEEIVAEGITTGCKKVLLQVEQTAGSVAAVSGGRSKGVKRTKSGQSKDTPAVGLTLPEAAAAVKEEREPPGNAFEEMRRAAAASAGTGPKKKGSAATAKKS